MLCCVRVDTRRHSTFFMVIFMSLTRARSMKHSVMVGRAGLQVMEKGHLLTWKTKSLEPSFVGWWSGVNILLFEVVEENGWRYVPGYNMARRQFSEFLERSGMSADTAITKICCLQICWLQTAVFICWIKILPCFTIIPPLFGWFSVSRLDATR